MELQEYKTIDRESEFLVLCFLSPMELFTKSSPQLERLKVLASDRLFELVRISRMGLQEYKTLDRESEFLVSCFLSSVELHTKFSAQLQRLQALASDRVFGLVRMSRMKLQEYKTLDRESELLVLCFLSSVELLTKSSAHLERLKELASDRLFGLVRISRMELQDYKTLDRESEFLVLYFLSSVELLTKPSAQLERLQALASDRLFGLVRMSRMELQEYKTIERESELLVSCFLSSMELLTKSSPQLKRLQVLARDRLFGLVRISRMELQDYKTVDRESEFLVLCFLSSVELLTKFSARLERLQELARDRLFGLVRISRMELQNYKTKEREKANF